MKNREIIEKMMTGLDSTKLGFIINYLLYIQHDDNGDPQLAKFHREFVNRYGKHINLQINDAGEFEVLE